jgi:glucokinase
VFSSAGDALEPVLQQKFSGPKTDHLPQLIRDYAHSRPARRLEPPVSAVCVAVAGPLDRFRKSAVVTNRGWSVTAAEINDAAGVAPVILLNDFEAVGFGVDVLLKAVPDAFVRLSRAGALPGSGRRPKATATIIGAGTGLGTAVLIPDAKTGRYRPAPGEGGHADFIAVEEIEFEIAQWVRKNLNRSERQPVQVESIVSGPGLFNVYCALSELEPHLIDQSKPAPILEADAAKQPELIVQHSDRDALCRKALQIWIRCYARAAKNAALFPLAPGGVFLAGGIAPKILPQLASGEFMNEFTRCDDPGLRKLLRQTPVFVITDERIGLYGCASVAVSRDRLGSGAGV